MLNCASLKVKTSLFIINRVNLSNHMKITQDFPLNTPYPFISSASQGHSVDFNQCEKMANCCSAHTKLSNARVVAWSLGIGWRPAAPGINNGAPMSLYAGTSAGGRTPVRWQLGPVERTSKSDCYLLVCLSNSRELQASARRPN